MPTEVDPRVHQLVDMGYAPKQARQAVGATKGGSVPDALDWILAKAVETELEVRVFSRRNGWKENLNSQRRS